MEGAAGPPRPSGPTARCLAAAAACCGVWLGIIAADRCSGLWAAAPPPTLASTGGRVVAPHRSAPLLSARHPVGAPPSVAAPAAAPRPAAPAAAPTGVALTVALAAALLFGAVARGWRRLAGPAPSVALAASVSEPFSIVASGRPRLGPLWGRRAAKIANTKNRSDLRRSKVYARFGKKIIMAVKAGGSADESANLMLRDVIREARAANVPTTNIERAIKRASDSDTADFKESTFEAYGKGGAGIVITVLTDNNNRATSDVKSTITHSGLTFASPGSVMFNFKRLGALVCAQPVSEDTAIEAAMEAGVDDVEVKEGDGGWLVLTDPKDLVPLKAALAAKGVECGEVKLVYHPTAAVECSDADAEFNEAAIERLEDLDDVDAVAHNMA